MTQRIGFMAQLLSTRQGGRSFMVTLLSKARGFAGCGSCVCGNSSPTPNPLPLREGAHTVLPFSRSEASRASSASRRKRRHVGCRESRGERGRRGGDEGISPPRCGAVWG